VATAPCVPAVREAVREWRESGYKKTSSTTAALLNYWFHTDHRLPNGERFRYHDAQRHAIETLVYLYEVVGIKRHRDLLTTFAPTAGVSPRAPPHIALLGWITWRFQVNRHIASGQRAWTAQLKSKSTSRSAEHAR
jgi:hypothetical protein